MQEDRQLGHLGLAVSLKASQFLFPLISLVAGAWAVVSPRLIALFQGQLPEVLGRSLGSLPLPWHTSAQRLCCTSQENGP